MGVNPLVVLGTEPKIERPVLGVRSKPKECESCQFASIGKGFCPDWRGSKEIKLAFLLEAPGSDEILHKSPLVGKSGKLWEYSFLIPLGISRDEVIISNVLRCNPPGNEYPVGAVSSAAERACRQYDNFHGDNGGDLVPGGISTWDPNIFILTFHPAAVLRTRAYFFLVKEEVKRAYEFARMGYRPCVAMGNKAAAIVFPALEGNGGLDTWHGHHFHGSLRTVNKENRFIKI